MTSSSKIRPQRAAGVFFHLLSQLDSKRRKILLDLRGESAYRRPSRELIADPRIAARNFLLKLLEPQAPGGQELVQKTPRQRCVRKEIAGVNREPGSLGNQVAGPLRGTCTHMGEDAESHGDKVHE